MHARALVLGLVLGVGAIGPVGLVHAQSARDLATARELFRAGVSSGEAGDWTSALDSFQRAHELSHRADVLLNVAAAQIALGQLVEGGETYRSFLADATPEMQAQHGDEARSALADVERRIAHVRVTIDGDAAGTHVRLDGDELDAAELGVDIAANPGDHHVELLRGTDTLASASGHVAESERTELRLVVPASPAAVAPDVATTSASGTTETTAASAEGGPSASTSVSPEALRGDAQPTAHGDDSTLWIVLGVVGGVLLVGAAVGIGIGVSGVASPQATPYQGSIAPFTIPIGP